MKKINRSQIPNSMPIGFTITGWLFFDRIHPAEWIWGCWYTLCAIIWIVILVDVFVSDYVKLKELE